MEINKNKSDTNLWNGVTMNIDGLDSTNDEPSYADTLASYEDTIKATAFKGEYPFDVIMENIENQFNDYINLEDNTNYVDIFYNAIDKSYNALTDDKETFKEEIKETIEKYYQTFIQKMSDLINDNFTISINDDLTDVGIDYIIKILYEFFILGARNNFKIVIANDLKSRMPTCEDHKEYNKAIKRLVDNYSPLITTIGPMEFLKSRGATDISEWFDNGILTGNFLRKYSPKLYKNEEFEVELISYITLVHQVKQEVFNNVG